MDAEPFPEEEPAEETAAWRFAAFRRLGFDIASSLTLAGSRADWHEVEKQLARGCSLEQAARIYF